MRDLDVMNAEIAINRQKEASDSLQMDLKIINECLIEGERERKAKSNQRESLKKEMQAYRDHLLTQKQLEKEREKEIEAMYKLEDDKVL